MPRTPAATPDHNWIYACTLPADPRGIAMATRNRRYKVEVDTVFTVLDAYCDQCKRTYDDVADLPCVPVIANKHLIGGPTGTRKHRVHDHDCVLFGCKLSQAEADRLRRAASNAELRRRNRVG